jgi:hypothetical protein
MKKILFAVISIAVLFASCGSGGDDGVPVFSPLPDGVYIAGGNYNPGTEVACYWTDSRRIDLHGFYPWLYPSTIGVSDGNVFVTGYDADGQRCYWVDGTRYELDKGQEICISNGNIFFVNKSDYSVAKFSPSVITVSGGKVYAAGDYIDYPDSYYLCYFVDGIRHDIVPNDMHLIYTISAITVSEGGKVYIAGISYKKIENSIMEDGKFWYYADGEFFEYPISEQVSIRQITLSGSKVYIFASSNYENCYWIDGEKVAVDLPAGSRVSGYAIARGKLWMAGRYWNGSQGQACYWVDGERYDLDGSIATSIFVEE